MAVAKPRNEGRLDELRIARICAADGLRPYWSKRSRRPNRAPGLLTPEFKLVLSSADRSEILEICRSKSRAWRKAVRTLQDVRLLDVTPVPRDGPPRGIYTASSMVQRCTWTSLAYFPAVTKVAGSMDDDDEHGLACLAAGIPFR
jgi:hypothetical protein